MKRLWKKSGKQLRKILTNNILFFPLVILLSSLLSCSIRSQKIATSVERAEAERILQETKRKWEGIRTLKGYFRLSADFKGKKGSIRALIIITLPERLRLELVSPGGTTEAVLTMINDRINLYYPSDNVFFTGDACEENINKALGISLLPVEIMPILMGKGFDLSAEPVKIIPDTDEITAVFHSKYNALKFDVTMDSQGFFVKKVIASVISTGAVFAEVDYKDIVNKEDFAYPRVVEINFPQKDVYYKVKITSAEYLLREMDEQLFNISLREGVKIYRLEEIEVEGTLLFGKE